MAKAITLDKKDILILKELNDNPHGLRVETIRRLTKLSSARTIYNHLNKLKKNKIVENIYPIWKIAKSHASSENLSNLLESNKKIQAHKFSFTLRLIKKPEWWDKRENKLLRMKEFAFKPLSLKRTNYQQSYKDYFIIQTFSNSIIFINQKKYWNNDPYLAYIEALEDTLQMLDFIQERFKYKFFHDGIPQFSVRSNHFVKVRDAIANKCREEGRKFECIINGKLRAWVDLSEPRGTEFGHKNYAVEDTSKYTKVVEDYIEGNASMPLDVDKRIENITGIVEKVVLNQQQHQNTMVYLDNNLKTHFEVLNGIKEAITELKEEIKKINGSRNN